MSVWESNLPEVFVQSKSYEGARGVEEPKGKSFLELNEK